MLLKESQTINLNELDLKLAKNHFVKLIVKITDHLTLSKKILKT
jgi:hypothetical protein